MFSLKNFPTLDFCHRVGCTREPEVVLDRTARIWKSWERPARSELRLCMACLAEAERELSARERAERIERVTRRDRAERELRPGSYA